MQRADEKTAAVSEVVQVRNEHGVRLEEPSPQLTGRFTECSTTRAHALDPYRGRLVLVRMMLLACYSTCI